MSWSAKRGAATMALHAVGARTVPQLGSRHIEWFVADPHRTSDIRRYIEVFLTARRIEEAVVDDARLLVSELASNVVRHTTATRVGVAVNITSHRVTVWVAENQRSPQPTFIHPPTATPVNSVDGRGLAIVDALAREWGGQRSHGTTVMWFNLELTETPQARTPIAGTSPTVELVLSGALAAT